MAEIIAIDKNEDRINAITDVVDRPIIGNATNDELLQRLDVATADQVVVSVGDLETSLVCVLYLKELGAKRIVVKVLNKDHEKILDLLKVDELVFPERSMAEIVGFNLTHPHICDKRVLNESESMVEIAMPSALVGQNLGDIETIAKNELRIVMVVNTPTGDIVPAPEPGYVVRTGDSLVMVGSNESIDQVEHAIAKYARE